jgi:hypothetical protein
MAVKEKGQHGFFLTIKYTLSREMRKTAGKETLP